MADPRPWQPGDRTCPTCHGTTPCQCCDLWDGPLDEWGYGRSGKRLPSGGHVRAHRLAYEQAHGPLEPGLVVMHMCDQPACCYLPHLRAGTHAENMRDGYRKGRVVPPGLFAPFSDDVPCPQGHVGNFYRGSNGKRSCRVCRRARVAAYARRKREGNRS